MDNSKEWGGKRDGAGRPPTGRRKRMVYVTDGELEAIKELVEKMRKEESKVEKYRGVVTDSLKSMDTRKTKTYDTYKEAHDAAEKLCKRTMGDRGSISVEQE